MRLWTLAALGLAACYAPPTEPACSITCTDSCPSGLTCTNGFCVSGDEVCMPAFVAVTAGADFACALDDHHARWCWGDNAHHQIAMDTASTITHATQAVGDPAWDTLSAGRDHVCGLAGGQLWCWGGNLHGQVDGNVIGDVAAPEQIVVPGVATWTAVSAGVDMTCAIGDSRLFCWGRDEVGQLGDGTATQAGIGAPVEVTGGRTDWTAVATSETHTCAVSQADGVLCWGHSDSGALGSGASGTSLVPVVAMPAPARLVAVTQTATCATRGDDSLWCWGDDNRGELGELNQDSNAISSSSAPVAATNTGGWTKLVGGADSLCGVAGSDAYCWGGAGGGGLATGVWLDSGVWQKVLGGATDVAAGCAVREVGVTEQDDLELGCAVVGGAVQCWGDNRSGQLAQGAATMATTPAPVVGGHVFSTISTGASHACGIAGSATWCWGSTELGQTTGMVAGNRGTNQFQRTPCRPNLDCDLGAPKQIGFAAGASALGTGVRHTCALVAGHVSCWGCNEQGQLGADQPPAPEPREVLQVGGAWASLVATGDVSQCAIAADAHTSCWGDDHRQQSQTPLADPVFDGAAQIAIGASFGCILDASDALACYGDDSDAQDGDGPPAGVCPDGTCDPEESSASCPADCGSGALRSVARSYTSIAISASTASCGVTAAGGIECWGHNDTGLTGDASTIGGRTYNAFPVPGLAGCTAVAMGGYHSCALCGGAVSCWGDDTVGELGDGQIRTAPTATPQLALEAAADPWVEIHAGDTYTCARSQGGNVSCWGFDPHGALGNGATSANLPVPIKLR